jgi:hypothetical protein
MSGFAKNIHKSFEDDTKISFIKILQANPYFTQDRDIAVTDIL